MFLCVLLGGMTVALTIGLLDVLAFHADAIKSQGTVSAGARSSPCPGSSSSSASRRPPHRRPARLYRAWLDPQKLASCNITASEVADAVASQNVESVAGQVGQQPAAVGPVLPDAGEHAGPAHRPRAVRRHHHQGRRRAAPRVRRPGIVRLRDVARVELGALELQPVLHVRRQPVGRPGHPPAPRHQRPRRRRPASGRRWSELETRFPDGVWITGSPTTPRRSSASRSTTWSARCSRPSRWWRSWCWCSCRTGGPR